MNIWDSPAGLDFESRILVKESAPALLRKALASPSMEAAGHRAVRA